MMGVVMMIEKRGVVVKIVGMRVLVVEKMWVKVVKMREVKVEIVGVKRREEKEMMKVEKGMEM
ncbi:hypothetical protein, partial [Staphylococcus pettenkoferi]|uniref:hypothetical protein n=1 Tax=Staphylococcus pettenkoferi TaxID=170573 RepID=UPI0011A30E14